MAHVKPKKPLTSRLPALIHTWTLMKTIIYWGYIGVILGLQKTWRLLYEVPHAIGVPWIQDQLCCVSELFGRLGGRLRVLCLGSLDTCDSLHFPFSSLFPYIPDVDPLQALYDMQADMDASELCW